MSTALLIIGRFYSRCGTCGKNADPKETHHTMATMEGPACGVEYTRVIAEYLGDDEKVRAMRPDLSAGP